MSRIILQIRRDQFRRLQHLRKSAANNGQEFESLGKLVEHLLDHLDQAITRPESWERDVFAKVYSDEVMDESNQAMYASGDEPKPVAEGHEVDP